MAIMNLLKGATGWVMGLSKWALGGAAVVVADQAVFDGAGTKAVANTAGKGAEDVLGSWNRYVNTGMNNIEALDRNLAEQSTSMGWFNTINGWFAGLCDFIGFDKGAEFFKERMVTTTNEIFDHIDDQRQMLDGHDATRKSRFTEAQVEAGVQIRGVDQTSLDATAPEAGEWTVGSLAGSFAYSLENVAVDLVGAVSTVVETSYDAIASDAEFGFTNLARNFNENTNAMQNKLDDVHGQPVVDTALEKAMGYAGTATGYIVPGTLAMKALNLPMTIAGGLSAFGKSTPKLSLQPLAHTM